MTRTSRIVALWAVCLALATSLPVVGQVLEALRQNASGQGAATAQGQAPAVCAEIDAPKFERARGLCTAHAGCALILSAQDRCPAAARFLERLNAASDPLSMMDILNAYMPPLSGNEKLQSAVAAAKDAARGAARASGFYKSTFQSQGLGTHYYEGGRGATGWSGPGFLVRPSGQVILGNFTNGLLEGAGMTVSRDEYVIAGNWSLSKPAGRMAVQTIRGEVVLSDNIHDSAKLGVLEKAAEQNGWSHIEEVAGSNDYLVRRKSDPANTTFWLASTLAPAAASIATGASSQSASAASGTQGLPAAIINAGERYQHSDCSLDATPHETMYRRCLAHTGCELVARRLSACNQLTALLSGLTARLGTRTDITNADLFEVVQPAQSKHPQLARYVAKVREISMAAPGVPAWQVMHWTPKDSKSYGQVFTYFEGRATLLPGGTLAKSTGSRMALGRGVAINGNGEMMRGDFKEGRLHGLGQVLKVSFDGTEMSAGRFRHGVYMGLSLHQRSDGMVTESMLFATDASGLNFKEAGIVRDTYRDGGISMSIHRSRNESEQFRMQSGRIDPFRTNQPPAESRSPQLSGGSAKP